MNDDESTSNMGDQEMSSSLSTITAMHGGEHELEDVARGSLMG